MYKFYTILYIFWNFIQFGLSQAVNTQVNIFEFNEGSNLHMTVYDLKRNDYDTCGESGKCESQGKPELELLCKIMNKTEGNNNISRQFINANTKTTMSADHAGNWHCTFVLLYKTQNGQMFPDSKNFTATFKLNTIKNDEVTDPKWIYIGSAIGLLALIIVVQTGCILYFKKKARGRRIQSFHSSANIDSVDNAVRYTKMPGQIKMEQLNKEPRESVIYEALENFPVPKPEPPPIDTLPRPDKIESETQQTTLTSKTLPPPTPKKPIKNKNIDNHKAEAMSISSLKRIKSRKPQPLPMDDPQMYEVMTPPGSLNKPESGLNRALPGKTHLPAQAVPVFPTGNNVPLLPSMIAAAQLKPVNKLNQKTVPPKPIPDPKKPAPFVLNAIKKTQEAPPVFRKPPAPLPIQPIPVDNGSISSDEEEWTYEPLSQYNQYNIYDNVPR